jgi:2,4-dienoyl-CoA reductase-like NADH-dependent reductase (Old Yellow Enzyme family)
MTETKPTVRARPAGESDRVAIGRALLADPEWVSQARDGRVDEITGFTAEHRRWLW